MLLSHIKGQKTMIEIEFTEEHIRASEYERYHHEEPFVQRKTEAPVSKSHKDMTHKKICEIVNITGNTLRKWVRDYQEGGIEKLEEISFYKPESILNQHREKIIAFFDEHPPAGIKEAMAEIEEMTGIRRSENRIREFLGSIGMKRRKAGMIPAEADPDEQESFFKKNAAPVLQKRNPDNGLYFLQMHHILC